MSLVLLLLGAAITQVFSVACFFTKDEGFRGAGRVVGGVSLLLLALSLMCMGPFVGTDVTVVYGVGFIFVLCAVITIAMGWRKFKRRNLPQAQPGSDH